MSDLPEFRNPFRNAKIVGTGIDSQAYHRQDAKRGDPQFAMSRSELMLFASCPARWVAGFSPKETDATAFGSLMDCLLTDGGRFAAKYAIQPEMVHASKSMKCVQSDEVAEGDLIPWQDCKEAREWKAGHKDQIIISHEEHAEADQAREKLLSDPIIGKLWACSDNQVMAVAEYPDPKTKLIIPVKVLIDLAPRKDSDFAGDLADYKTARNASPRAWVNVIDDRNYDCQAALFMDVYNAATGEDRYEFLHIVQENLFPWQVGRRIVSTKFIQLGRDKYLSALSLYCSCLKANEWPAWEVEWGISEPEPYMIERATRGLFQINPPDTQSESNENDFTP